MKISFQLTPSESACCDASTRGWKGASSIEGWKYRNWPGYEPAGARRIKANPGPASNHCVDCIGPRTDVENWKNGAI